MNEDEEKRIFNKEALEPKRQKAFLTFYETLMKKKKKFQNKF